MIDAIEQNLLREVADLDSLPVGAYNIRANGQLAGRNTTANIDIVTKNDKPGIDIYIRRRQRPARRHPHLLSGQKRQAALRGKALRRG